MTERQFKTLLLLLVLVMALQVSHYIVWPNPLVDTMYAYLDTIDSGNLHNENSVFVVAALAVFGLLLYFICLYGLWTFRFWARPTFILANMLMFVLNFVFSVTVSDPIFDCLSGVENMLIGAIIAVSHTRPISPLFVRHVADR